VQTSVLVFVDQGSSLQMIFQLGVTLLSVFILHTARPYIKRGDLYLAVLAQWVIFAISFIALLIDLENQSVQPLYDTLALQNILLILFLSVPVVAALQIIWQILTSERFVQYVSTFQGRAPHWIASKLKQTQKLVSQTESIAPDEKADYANFMAKFKTDPLLLEAFFFEAQRKDKVILELQEEKQNFHVEARELGEKVGQLEGELEMLRLAHQETRFAGAMSRATRRSTVNGPDSLAHLNNDHVVHADQITTLSFTSPVAQRELKHDA